MQRLQLDPDEKITRKEYLKRKKLQANGLKKRSKISYIMIGVVVILSIYVFAQFYVYSKENNFKYVAGDGVSKQKVYSMYYVTEGYTYDPVYSLNSIHSDGFEDEMLYQNSGMCNIISSKEYVYGIKSDGLYRFVKSSNDIENIVNDKVNKYTLFENRIYYTTGDTNVLKYVDIDSKEIKELGIDNVSEILVDNNNIYIVRDEKTKKKLIKYDKEGNSKQELTKDANVSYIVQDESKVYFVNKNDYNKIYYVGKDGTSETKLDDIVSMYDKGTIKEVDGSKYMFSSNNYLYYININESNTLWRINLEDKSKEQVIAVPVQILQNVDNTLFYKIKNEMGVYLYNFDTKFMSQVTKRNIKEFSVDKTSDIISDTTKTDNLSKN